MSPLRFGEPRRVGEGLGGGAECDPPPRGKLRHAGAVRGCGAESAAPPFAAGGPGGGGKWGRGSPVPPPFLAPPPQLCLRPPRPPPRPRHGALTER